MGREEGRIFRQAENGPYKDIEGRKYRVLGEQSVGSLEGWLVLGLEGRSVGRAEDM